MTSNENRVRDVMQVRVKKSSSEEQIARKISQPKTGNKWCQFKKQKKLLHNTVNQLYCNKLKKNTIVQKRKAIIAQLFVSLSSPIVKCPKYLSRKIKTETQWNEFRHFDEKFALTLSFLSVTKLKKKNRHVLGSVSKPTTSGNEISSNYFITM